MRRYSKPRNVKLPPFARSTILLFSSFISTLSLANSSRSRCSTALASQSCRGWEPIYLIEIEVTEQRRNHSTLGNSLLPSCLQDHLEQPHHIIILHTSSHLLEQQVVLHIIEVGPQVKI